MNRREEEKAALARKAAEAQFALNTKKTTAVPSEREMELEALALKTARLRALRLARESAKSRVPRR